MIPRIHIIGGALAIATVASVTLLGGEREPGREEVCQPGYAKSHRMMAWEALELKRSLLKPGQYSGDYELDHIVPLCLGGSNDAANLQLQPFGIALDKDQDEWMLCRAVCAGDVPLDEARRYMREWRPRN